MLSTGDISDIFCGHYSLYSLTDLFGQQTHNSESVNMI